MYITYIGHNHVHNMDFEISRPKGSGDYLALIVKSHAAFTINDQHILTPPHIFFLYKEGTPQYYQAYKEPFSNDWFHFKLEQGDEDFFTKLHIPFETPIPLDNATDLSMLIKNMAREKYVGGSYNEEVISHYMHIFFFKIATLIHSTQQPKPHTHYDKMFLLRSKIYNTPYEKWCVKRLSDELNLSPYYFQRLYKQVFSVPCMTDIIYARIEYAKYYLSQTDLSIKYISEISGYENSEHFMRQFKKAVGLTPTEYRKKIQDTLKNNT